MTQRQLAPNGWRSRVRRGRFGGAENWRLVDFYGFVAVFERDAAYDEKHGAERFAVLFLGEDGIASYDALFCQGTDGTTP